MGRENAYARSVIDAIRIYQQSASTEVRTYFAYRMTALSPVISSC